MSLINISNLTFSYDGNSENVFENVNIQIDTEWKLGLIGRNGRGKTTLLKLLLKEIVGSGSIISNVDFEYFPYNVTDSDDFTIDVIREIAKEAEDWEIYREMSLLGMGEYADYQQYCTLSGGEQTKAMLAGMFLRKNNFLLIDEPTTHLDSDGRHLLSEYLSHKKGFILVSHDRQFLDMCTDHIMSINKCGIELQKGNYSDWQRNKDMQDNFELAQNEKLKKDIRRLESAAKRTAEWSNKAESAKIGFDPMKVEKSISRRPYESAKSKKIMSRSTSIVKRQNKAIQEKNKLLHNIEQTAELKFQPLKFHLKRLVQLEKVSLRYGEKVICENIDLVVNQGERIAVTGKNGSGKSSILKLICGEDIEYTGNLIKNGQLKISYVPQKTDHLHGSLMTYAESLGIDISLFFSVLRKLDFSREMFEHDIENFSEGQKKKVMIAGSLCEKAHIYIWDEPLNFIDIISRIQIEKLILESSVTMIFVEHDSAFTEKIANKNIAIT
ncbi:MAG: ABC-F type ribosomal protection protein [Ruminococcus sp.]|nr:ABC-F type ribosomal protection protein [Ruminococcus sp.]